MFKDIWRLSIRKLFIIFKLVTITLITATITVGISLLINPSGFEHLLGIQQLKSESARATHGQIISPSTQAMTPTNEENLIPKAFQGIVVYEAKLKAKEKVIALTFDDGPSPKNTAQILEILKQNNIKATFFMIGEMVKYFPQVAKQVAADGHAIGNHTWHHWYRRMNVATAASEIDRTAEIIYKTTGQKTTMFRPPGGFLNNGLAQYAKNHKYVVMMWSEESGDAERHSPQVPMLIKNVLKNAKSGAIVLIHDGGGNRIKSVKALPAIITGLKAQGYQFVTIPELLEMQSEEQKNQPPNSQPVM
ncbi:polysaccharide deacetylase family protein [Anabaena cylindrica UHCC 0172]|uniref:polysaccharide deacetylase family protein n=1 Tax=Anabaena cylindrica TaxID=1165 RepID=UPI002B207CD1|nr:polysaccharide deacetylase family protein [Anabaena cylindrica]MEA5549995.1 polysaccharide deacetylase family protein [Anabaena cylindrica UHCC 0172]